LWIHSGKFKRHPGDSQFCGTKSAVVMEKGGAEVYEDLIEFNRTVPRALNQPQSYFQKKVLEI
jgi:hypothetical protein